MLSTHARSLTFAVAAAHGAMGLLLFLAPAWAAPHFAWKVSPLVAMTMGGWCLGNAWAALVVASRRRVALVLPGLVYLALFALFETGVVIAFRGALKLDHWLAWLYLAALAVTLVQSAAWIAQMVRERPSFEQQGRRTTTTFLGVNAFFVLLVAFLGLYGLLAPQGARGLGGGIFPEVLTPFSLRAFGAFYLAVAMGPLTLFFLRGAETALTHMYASWGLILFITLAALVFIGAFDLAARPGQWIYLGIYVAVGAVTASYMLGGGTGKAAAATGPRR
jgi:hypothetical protein